MEKESNTLECEQGKMLFSAIEAGSFEYAKAALKAGADANAKDKYLDTPLHWAACNENAEIALMLIANGADINARDAFGRTPLHIAAIHKNMAVAKLLAGYGANPCIKDNYGNTAFDYADEEMNKIMVASLIRKE